MKSILSWLTILSYVFYGLGFTVTIAVLAIATALSRDLLIKRIRGAGGLLEKIMGGLMAIVGLYLIYFAICELAFQYGWGINQSITDVAFSIQGWIINKVSAFLSLLGLL